MEGLYVLADHLRQIDDEVEMTEVINDSLLLDIFANALRDKSVLSKHDLLLKVLEVIEHALNFDVFRSHDPEDMAPFVDIKKHLLSTDTFT